MMKHKPVGAVVETNMKTIKILPLILILLLGSGCLIFPFPSGSPSMRTFYDVHLRYMTEGSTTREEVISRIGEPDIKLKKFILYKHKVEGRGWRLMGGFLGRGGSIHRFEGEWIDVSFEFDEQGVLTEYRFIDLGREYAPYPDVTECNFSCDSNYYDCLISTEKQNTSLSQCEDTAETCFDQCNVIRIKHYERDKNCDPGMESCT